MDAAAFSPNSIQRLIQGLENSSGREPLIVKVGLDVLCPHYGCLNCLNLIWLELFPGTGKEVLVEGEEEDKLVVVKAKRLERKVFASDLGKVIYHSPCPTEHDLAAGDTMSPSSSQMSLHYLALLRTSLRLTAPSSNIAPPL